jgi:hypothetical protein
MRIRRRLPILFGVLLVAAAVALVVFLRKHAPPEPARLLPSADGFAYVNLKWVRRAGLLSSLPAVSHDPDYEQFLQATGFDFERDLDQAAMAIHYPSSLPPQPGPPSPRFSEVFVGRIDGVRLRDYLRKLARNVESDDSIAIYEIPLEGRTLRVAILGPDTVAASNHPDPQVIRAMVERSRKLASPFGGPALLRQYYKHFPLTSLPLSITLAWAIFKVAPQRAGFDGPSAASEVSALFSQPAVVETSARYSLGNVHLRAEAFTASPDEAKHVADKLGTFLALFHTAESSVGSQGPDPDVRQFFDSLKAEQHGDRAVLNAVMAPAFIHKALASGPSKELETQPSDENPARK